MKKILCVLAVGGIVTVSASAQYLKGSNVPSAVRSAFQKEHPHNVQVRWEKEGANYEASFEIDGKTMSSVINKNGTILETETEIAVRALPQSAQQYVKDHYKGAIVEGAAKIVKKSGEVNYEAEVNRKDIVFDADGKFLREEKD